MMAWWARYLDQLKASAKGWVGTACFLIREAILFACRASQRQNSSGCRTMSYYSGFYGPESFGMLLPR